MPRRRLIGRAPGGTFFFTRIADEAKALARKGTDKALPLTVIAEGVPGSVDARAQSRFRDYSSLPDGRDQVVLADHTFAMLDQICQKIEYLWLDNNRHPSATQLAAICVEYMIFEQIEQFLTHDQA